MRRSVTSLVFCVWLDSGIKREPFLTNICHIGDYYTTDQIKDFVWSLKSGSHSELDSHFQTSSEMLKLGDMPPHIKQAKHITTLWNTVAPLYSTNIEEIEEVLSFIPGDDRKIWVDVGIALRNSNFENAYDIWCRWSAKSDKYDTYEQQKNWDTFEGYNRVTLGKIYHLAAKHGYKRSSVDSLTCGQNSVLADVLDTPEVPAALDIHTVIGRLKTS